MIFYVNHEPVPQPRARVSTVGGFARGYTPKGHPVHALKELIAWRYRECGGKLLDGEVNVEIIAVFTRPKSATRKKGINPDQWYPKKCDVDNLAKAVLDSLNGHAYHDDRQVCILWVAKRVSSTFTPAGLYIRVVEIKHDPPPLEDWQA